MVLLDKLSLKKDYYQTECYLEFNNCEIVLDTNPEWIFIKVNQSILNQFSEIKREISLIVNRNSEFYCDCIKIIKTNDNYEEVIKVKTDNIELKNGVYNIKLNVYGIWFNKTFYGPMIKIIHAESNLNQTNEISLNQTNEISLNEDSDEEIDNYFNSYRFNLKK